MRRRAPQQLRAGVEAALAAVTPDTTLAEVQRLWPVTVGEWVADAARPVAEHNGMLRVTCDSAVWANELELLAPEILKRLNECLSSGEISALRCELSS